jgi:histidinol-phosphate/aromatic aminotransferase/cobyric acid decarboxylase-like protein
LVSAALSARTFSSATTWLPFIDLAAQQAALRPSIERGIETVLRYGQYIMDPEVKQLDDKLAAYVGVKHCITASSGTDTLLIAIMALGIGPGDEVITTPFTFIATSEMIALQGAKPVLSTSTPEPTISSRPRSNPPSPPKPARSCPSASTDNAPIWMRSTKLRTSMACG